MISENITIRKTLVISSGDCVGVAGGSSGVAYRLFLANKKYNALKNCTFCFNNATLEYDADELKSFSSVRQSRRLIEKYILPLPHGIYNILKTMFRCIVMFSRLLKTYDRKASTLFVCLDFDACFALLFFYKIRNVLLVHHNQGSIYTHWSSNHNKKSSLLKSCFEAFTFYCLKRVKEFAFPSEGAAHDFIETSSKAISELVNKRGYKVLYNGDDIIDPGVNSLGLNIRDHFGAREDSVIFISVARLDELKNVQAIPAVFAQLQSLLNNQRLYWILIGTGAFEEEVQSEIDKYDIADCTLRIKQFLPHDDIMNLLAQSDCYLLLQKRTVFDYATIEALGMGCVPILMDVGGNKEFFVEDNGLLLPSGMHPSYYAEAIAKYIKETELEPLKERNRKLQERLWSGKPFLEGYSRWFDSVS